MLCSTAATQRSRDRIPLSATGQVQHRWQMRRIKLMNESEEGGQSVNDLDHTTFGVQLVQILYLSLCDWRSTGVDKPAVGQLIPAKEHAGP